MIPRSLAIVLGAEAEMLPDEAIVGAADPASELLESVKPAAALVDVEPDEFKCDCGSSAPAETAASGTSDLHDDLITVSSSDESSSS